LKVEPRQVSAFLRNPGTCRLVLLHGEDEGLIRERAQALTLLVAGDLHDPFRVVELAGRDGWAQLGSEMAALSMIGGRRVVRVREVTDAALESVRAALRGPGAALAVLEAPGLGKGKLRSFVEAAPDAACIGCYPEEGRAAAELIRGIFGAEGIGADPDACVWLAEACGTDRAVLRGEIEKLALLAGSGGRVDIDMARSSAGDAAGASGDEALVAATSGDPMTADACVEKAVAEGLAGVGLIRVALMHLQKLHQARLRMEGGLSAAEAVRTLRPPVFYRALPGMTASVNLWSADLLLRALDEARAVELACKTTGSRPDVLACRFVAALARQAQARRGR
jgi:DNA polymerase-3 subunit delta